MISKQDSPVTTHLTLPHKNSLSAPKISLAVPSFTHTLVTTTMDEPIPTPPYAAAAHTASILATALPNNNDVDAFDPTVMFRHHYDAHGRNIFSLTPEFTSNGNGNPVDNSLQHPLPSNWPTTMSSSPWKRLTVFANRPTPCCAAVTSLITVVAIIDSLAIGADALLYPPPNVVRPLPMSVFKQAFSPANPSKSKKRKEEE